MMVIDDCNNKTVANAISVPEYLIRNKNFMRVKFLSRRDNRTSPKNGEVLFSAGCQDLHFYQIGCQDFYLIRLSLELTLQPYRCYPPGTSNQTGANRKRPLT